jgi:rhodanese-related sulfurtransferase
MRREIMSLAIVAAAGLAVNAVACNCGCKAAKAEAKPEANAKVCPFTSAKSSKCGSGKCGASAKPVAASLSSTKAAAHDPEYGIIGTGGLKRLLDSGKAVTLVDARSGKWDDGTRIAHAQQLASDASEEAIGNALPDKNAMIVVYCTSIKCPASAKLAKRLVDLEYNNIIKYPAGIAAWEKGGNKIRKTK